MFEQLRQRLAGEAKNKKEVAEIVTVQPEQVEELNLSWTSHFNNAALQEHLQEFPGLTLRVAGTTEYIVGDTWRKRDDIGQIIETRARLYRAELVAGLVAEYKARGFGAVMVGTDEQSDNARFYNEIGFSEIERVIYYEKPNMHVSFVYEGEPLIVVPYEPARMDDLVAVDHAAFPWLWWNSREELEYYVVQEDVSVSLTYLASTMQPVGYFGYTLYEQWAHLDRLAVVPEVQGKRIGAFQLREALSVMAENGARRVTLSTQQNNHQSQRLYEGFGFHRVRNLEHSYIGKLLNK